MDLLTVVSHELGHVLGFGDNQSGYAVMDEDLEPGVRYLLDDLGFDGDPDQPVDDRALLLLAMRAAEHEAASKAISGARGGPSFEFDSPHAEGAAKASIDWQNRADGWGTRFSPFASPSKSAANFSDFLLKLFGKDGDAEQGKAGGFDELGGSLRGHKPDDKGTSL
jgi:hypothetical protein